MSFDLLKTDLLPSKRGLAGTIDESPLESLRGARILDVGFPDPQASIEGGGLAFDYVRPGENVVRRLVIGHNELGSWIELDEEIPNSQSGPTL